jgi:hypothetical protein
MGEVRNGDNLNMITMLFSIKNDIPCFYMILRTPDLEKCWLSLHSPGCWLDIWGLQNWPKWSLDLNLLYFFGWQMRRTFLMKTRALFTMTLGDVHILLWNRQDCVSKLEVDFRNVCYSFDSALYEAQGMWNHTQPWSVISCYMFKLS